MTTTDNSKSDAIDVVMMDNEGVAFFDFCGHIVTKRHTKVACITVCGMHEHGSLAPGGSWHAHPSNP